MEDVRELVDKQKAYFSNNETKLLSLRMQALENLRQAVLQNEQDLMAALKADLNKSEFEGYASEIGVVLGEIRFALKHLKKWMKPKRVRTPITHFGAVSYVYPEPYGVTLIISPWNYPLQLTLIPLIGAIAAGNCAVLKPSELSPHTSQVLSKLVKSIFPEQYVAVVEGGVEASEALLAEKFDFIFYTGGGRVGRVVMEAAARNLTPVALELGGKSPAIVHRDANLKLAAKRIAWGKFLNAGQTCVSPDYLLVHREIKQEFIRHLQGYIEKFYGEDVLHNGRFPRMINEHHFDRVRSFLEQGRIVAGGHTDKSRLTIEPTILDGVAWEDPVMQEEIFGPVLPILEYEDLPEAVRQINTLPKPLSLYLFSESGEVKQQVVGAVSFGGGCINDTVMQYVSPYLPFGGVGESGMGAYHGKGSFDAFSHQKSVLKQTTRFDLPFRYPNLKNGIKWIRMFLR